MTQRPCLIVGASGNIGEGIAQKLIAEGRPVALTHSLNSKPAESLADIEGKGRWYAVDVQNSASVNELVASVEKDFGAAPDLVYCAGVTKDASISRITDEVWDSVIGINLTGAFYFVRALCRPLMAVGNGRIVLIGSVAGSKGNVGQLSYSATKGGLEAMCRVIALEMGRFGATCNVVAPGAIEGRMTDAIPPAAVEQFKKATPLRRFGKPGEVAALVSFLLSEEGQYITGQSIKIDGGMTAA